MKKSDIESRLKEIDNRLNEFPTICEREKRELTEEETREKDNLIAERSDLTNQLNDINSKSFKEMKDEKTNFSLLQAIRSVVNGGRFEGDYADEVRSGKFPTSENSF